MRNKFVVIFLLMISFGLQQAWTQNISIALGKYEGGGDWYANPTALKNLAQFCNQQLNTQINTKAAEVSLGSPELLQYPFVHITGHGRINFSNEVAKNLRKYLISGGFLHIDDNYGMGEYVVGEMKKVFPELSFVELPFNHPIYHQKFNFPEGLPKIHEHDNKPPKGYGLIYKNRLICFYTVECDLGDGWEDQNVHNDPPEIRQKALQMGANIIQYVFTK